MFKVYFSEFPLSKYGPLNENAMNEYWIWHTGLVVWNGLNNNTRNLACFTQWVTSLLEWEGSLKHYHSFAQVSWAILKVILQPWMVGINRGGWDTYLQRMSRDGAWGEWIALWGLVNTFSLPVALVSSLRERGLQIINPATNGDEGGDLTVMVLLGHEAEVHYHSLEAPKDPVTIRRRKSHRGDLPKGLGKSYDIPKESLKG